MTDQTLDDVTELRELMDRALTDLDTPTDRLHRDAVRRGRVVRRRRRATAAVGGLALAAAVALVGGIALAGGDETTGRVAHDVPPASGPTERAYERPAGWWDMPGAAMRDRLAGALPATLSIRSANLGDQDLAPGDSPTGGWLQVDLVDAQGRPAGGVNVVLYPPFDDGGAFVRERTTCPGNLASGGTCQVLHDATGAVVGRSAWSSTGGVVVRETTRLTAEGALVYVAVSNSSDEKWGDGSSVDRARPPLSLGQVQQLAADPTWTSWRAAR